VLCCHFSSPELTASVEIGIEGPNSSGYDALTELFSLGAFAAIAPKKPAHVQDCSLTLRPERQESRSRSLNIASDEHKFQ